MSHSNDNKRKPEDTLEDKAIDINNEKSPPKIKIKPTTIGNNTTIKKTPFVSPTVSVFLVGQYLRDEVT